MAGDNRRLLLYSRLAVTVIVLGIACALLFIHSTNIRENIASGLIGTMLGYWFGPDGESKQTFQQTGGVTNNATIQNTVSTSERTANTDSIDER